MAGCCGGGGSGGHNNHHSKENKGKDNNTNFIPLLLGIGGIILLHSLLNEVF